jgi:hypothetical protein
MPSISGTTSWCDLTEVMRDRALLAAAVADALTRAPFEALVLAGDMSATSVLVRPCRSGGTCRRRARLTMMLGPQH